MCESIDSFAWQKLAKRVNKASVSKGFWADEYPLNHHIMLVVSELCEAIEADRQGRYAYVEKYMDKLETEEFVCVYACHIKGTLEEELADAAMRLLDIIAQMGWIIDDIVCPAYVSLKYYGSFPLYCYSITEDLVLKPDGDRQAVLSALYGVMAVAHMYGIDLLNHIELKMRYNKTRPRLHGKRY
ncbi:hypothetical protein [uncultured Porphyromonas sp.]|uniref:hypothetical protein n=1 Tax=uncultured Porphyromonas sp. TaxID=159274 RepID=UPI00261E5245|nr:hypothetical protein [uncultured Porphyromonas sp.]